MLGNLEGGSDDLDDLLDELAPAAKGPSAAEQAAKARRQERDQLAALGGISGSRDDHVQWEAAPRTEAAAQHASADQHFSPAPGSAGARTRADPSASSGGGMPAADRMADWDSQVKRKHSPLLHRAKTPTRSSYEKLRRSQDHGTSDIERFMAQSFNLLFGDEFQNMPLTLLSIFKGQLRRTFDNRDFLDSADPDTLHLKYIVLHSARLAFHFALESFILGEVDLPEYGTFEAELRVYDQEWFLGSEEYLWNAAIERNLPNLERLI